MGDTPPSPEATVAILARRKALFKFLFSFRVILGS